MTIYDLMRLATEVAEDFSLDGVRVARPWSRAKMRPGDLYRVTFSKKGRHVERAIAVSEIEMMRAPSLMVRNLLTSRACLL